MSRKFGTSLYDVVNDWPIAYTVGIQIPDIKKPETFLEVMFYENQTFWMSDFKMFGFHFLWSAYQLLYDHLSGRVSLTRRPRKYGHELFTVWKVSLLKQQIKVENTVKKIFLSMHVLIEMKEQSVRVKQFILVAKNVA